MDKHSQQIEWDRYSNCAEQFDLRKLSDLNLIIVLLKETEINNQRDIEELLNKLDNAEWVIHKLKEQIIELKTKK